MKTRHWIYVQTGIMCSGCRAVEPYRQINPFTLWENMQHKEGCRYA